MSETTDPTPHTPSEPSPEALEEEVARLRARNTELEEAQQASTGQRILRVARAVGSALLIIVGVLCLTITPLAIWGRNLLLDTNRYVETLKPVASNTGVQDAIIKEVDAQVSANVNVKDLLANTQLPPRAIQALSGPLQGAVNSLVNTVTTDFVRSDEFQTLWVGINRLAHQQITYLLTGKPPANSSVHVDSQGRVLLDLSQVVDNVKKRLVDRGITVASKVPTVGATLEIANVQGLKRARTATNRLNTIANWLPWIGLILVAGGIAAARRRRRALIRSALGVGLGMIVIGLGLLIARNIYLNAIPPDRLDHTTAGYLFDTLVRFLRWGIRLLLLITLLVALGAWVSGPSRSAVGTRRFVSSAPRKLGERLDTGPVGPFVERYAMALRIGIIALACIVVLLLGRPTLAAVITIAVIAVVLLLIVELLRASAARGRATPRPSG